MLHLSEESDGCSLLFVHMKYSVIYLSTVKLIVEYV